MRRRTALVAAAAAGAALVVVGAAVMLPASTTDPRTELEARFPSASATSAQQPSPLPSVQPLEILSQERLSERTTRFRLGTDLVPAQETDDGPSAVVTLPQDYDPARELPVVYLLGGTSPGESPMSWHDAAAAEQAAGDLQAILVAVDDGSYGWYTDWTGSPDTARGWRTHHLEQVIPWVDQRYATAEGPGARAIVGASAGGFGALSYAEQRPDLFGAAASFSGLLSLSAAQDRGLILEEARAAAGSPDALFGDGSRTTQADWDAHDPSLATASLADRPVWLYSGSSEPFEARLQRTTQEFAQRAEASGAVVESRTYEQLIDDGAPMPAGTCSAGHEWTCWSMALHDLAPELQEFFDR